MEQAGGVARVGGGRPILSVGFQPYNSVAAPREHGLNQFFALDHLSSFARERVSCGSPNLSMLRCCRSQPLQTTTPLVTHPGLHTIVPDFRRCASCTQHKTDVRVRSPESSLTNPHFAKN